MSIREIPNVFQPIRVLHVENVMMVITDWEEIVMVIYYFRKFSKFGKACNDIHGSRTLYSFYFIGLVFFWILLFPITSWMTFIGSFGILLTFIQIISLFSKIHLDFPNTVLEGLYGLTAFWGNVSIFHI